MRIEINRETGEKEKKKLMNIIAEDTALGENMIRDTEEGRIRIADLTSVELREEDHWIRHFLFSTNIRLMVFVFPNF